jgi:chemotaxis protein MotB
MGKFKEEPKPGPPAYMVSFGDMMTLILTFFILLVSMSEEQQAGLVAKGVGSFIERLRSHGLNGVLSEAERRAIFEGVRARFNLPPEEDPERREEHLEASQLELVRAEALSALAPHDELVQPAAAVFEPGSSELSSAARAYLDKLAPTLRPLRAQVLVLEGHADEEPAGVAGGAPLGDRWLAFARASAVRDWLLSAHDYPIERVLARVWIRELERPDVGARCVDARLVTPSRKDP